MINLAQQCNRWKMFRHINPYRWKVFPLIVILNYKTWKNDRRFSTYYILPCQIPLITLLKGKHGK